MGNRRISYIFARFFSKLFKKKEILNKHFRRGGITLGRNCYISSNINLCERHLLTIGNNVIVSENVAFITHDASFSKIGHKNKSLFGKIIIGDNCFIGNRSIILYGVTLPKNTIVAAGSVVCNSFDEENIVIAGNPARKIGTWEDLKNRHLGMEMFLEETLNVADETRFIKRKIK